MKQKRIRRRQAWMVALLVGVYVIIYGVVSSRYYQRLGVFGCGDECINYTAGHFILQGKSLYREIFFNHQPLLAYLSALIQRISNPPDLYHLVLYHRIAVWIYSFCMGIFLIIRFRIPALLFLILYEGTKYYMYGYQFIGESFVVYPAVYLFGIWWEAHKPRHVHRTDPWVAALGASLVVWVREPYIPLAIFLFVLIMWRVRKTVDVREALGLFFITIAIPFVRTSAFDYLYQVGFINLQLTSDFSLWRSLLYPFVVIIQGSWSYVGVIEFGLAIFFWVGMLVLASKRERWVNVFGIVGILFLAGVRTVSPGIMFYEAFHMLVWYALFVAVTVFVIASLQKSTVQRILIGAFVGFSLWAFGSNRSFIWENVDRAGEFESQYARYTLYSQVIGIVSSERHTLFLDMWDDIIYWEAKRPSSYPLSIYIPIQSMIPTYQQTRYDMFVQSPPDLYYSCPNLQTPYNSLPEHIEATYTQLQSQGKPSCLYVSKKLLAGITAEAREKLKSLGFSVTIGL